MRSLKTIISVRTVPGYTPSSLTRTCRHGQLCLMFSFVLYSQIPKAFRERKKICLVRVSACPYSIIYSPKYSSESCIKGHRSSSCKHTSRPLFEIKKKGRPVSQCKTCRELRQSKKLHSKCICATQDNDLPKPSRRKSMPFIFVYYSSH